MVQHLDGKGHQAKLQLWEKRVTVGKQDILDALQAYQAKHPDVRIDATDLDNTTKTRRIEVCENHLRQGVALEKFDDPRWRSQFEGGSLPKLTGSTGMRQLVPIVRGKHYMKNEEQAGKAVHAFVSFD